MIRKLTFVLLLIVFLMMGMTAFAQPADTLDDGGPGSPVPEPATITLMAVGLAAVAYAGWRRNHKK